MEPRCYHNGLNCNNCLKYERKECPQEFEVCENCGESVHEDDLQECLLIGTRTCLFVCPECTENLESFKLIL